jgi:hypothetical protein
MKFCIGYQYLVIVTLEIIILLFPILWIKIVIESLNMVSSNLGGMKGPGIILLLINLLGSIFILHYFNKKYKLIDVFAIIFIFYQIHPYATMSIVLIRIFVSYFLSN